MNHAWNKVKTYLDLKIDQYIYIGVPLNIATKYATDEMTQIFENPHDKNNIQEKYIKFLNKLSSEKTIKKTYRDVEKYTEKEILKNNPVPFFKIWSSNLIKDNKDNDTSTRLERAIKLINDIPDVTLTKIVNLLYTLKMAFIIPSLLLSINNFYKKSKNEKNKKILSSLESDLNAFKIQIIGNKATFKKKSNQAKKIINKWANKKLIYAYEGDKVMETVVIYSNEEVVPLNLKQIKTYQNDIYKTFEKSLNKSLNKPLVKNTDKNPSNIGKDRGLYVIKIPIY